MPNSLHSSRYQAFRALLIAAREAAGMTQVEVAERLGKPQSFVSKYERGERRLDFTEFLEPSDLLGLDLVEFSSEYRLKANLKSR